MRRKVRLDLLYKIEDRLQQSTAEANATLGRRFFEEQDRLRGGPAEQLRAPNHKTVLGGNSPVDRHDYEYFAKSVLRRFDGNSPCH